MSATVINVIAPSSPPRALYSYTVLIIYTASGPLHERCWGAASTARSSLSGLDRCRSAQQVNVFPPLRSPTRHMIVW
jgi:hypothetical protein